MKVQEIIGKIFYYIVLFIHGECYLEQRHVWYTFKKDDYISPTSICSRCGTIIKTNKIK